MKRAVPLIILLLILSLIPLPSATAAEADITEAIRTVSGLSPLEDALYRGMMATEEKIDISAYNATADEIVAAMQHLSDCAPELFHVERTYKYNTKTVTPTYLYTGAALLAARAEYLFALDVIAEGVDPAWSDAEICLYLHDYLCRAFAYDTAYEIFDAYGFLTEGRGVCQAYTLTYTALLSRFGIPVTYATGSDDGMPHIWNVVTIDGEHYHVDVTWGDALTAGADYFGRATHENFLKSDAAIDAAGHKNRENRGGIVCDSTRYDESALSEVNSSVAFLDGEVYAIADGRVLRFDRGIEAAPTPIYTVNEEWRTGLEILLDKPAGIAAYGGILYVNTPKSIRALDPATGYTEIYLTVTSGMIMTIAGFGEALHYSVADNIHGESLRILSTTLPSALPPCTGEHAYTVYATEPASCTAVGAEHKKCTVCGHRTSTEIPMLAHVMNAAVILPTYGVGGYTELTCINCGTVERILPTDPLPLPSRDDYRAAVTEAEEATTAYGRLTAIRCALAIEPHIENAESLPEYTALRAVMAAYDAGAAAANAAHAEQATLLFFSDFSFFTGAGTALLLLFLAIRRVLGS